MAQPAAKLFILKLEFKENSLDQIKENLAAHKTHYKQALDEGNLVIGGCIDRPLLDALVVFRNLSQAEIEKLVKSDPLYTNGLLEKYSIRPFYAGAGDPALKNDLIQH